MSEWRDRGYVLDSDDEDLTLSSPTTPSSSQNQNPQHISAQISELISTQDEQKDNPEARDGQQDVVMQEDGLSHSDSHVRDNSVELGHLPDGSSGNKSQDHELDGGIASSANQETTLPAPATSTKPEAIILISQPRRSPSPDVPPSKAAKTYSRKFNPATARKAANNARPSKPVDLPLDNPTTDGVQNNAKFKPVSVEVDSVEGFENGPPRIPSEPMPTSVLPERRSSVSSSDLSDVDMEILSSSPHRFFSRDPPSQQVRGATQLGTRGQPLSITPDLSSGFISTQHTATLCAPLRSFRTRRAIQLHPYAIESERYRQALKARGYRPVQVIAASQQPRERQETQDAEFQTRDSQTQSQNALQTQETTPPDSSASSDPPRRHRLLELMANDQDEFPDVDAILRREVVGGIQQGYKRRKTFETPHNDRLLHPGSSSTSGARGKLKSLNLSRRLSAPGSHELLPPSPPRTSSPSNADPISAIAPRFRLPRGLTPSVVPTPLPSSPERATLGSARRQRQIMESSDSDGADANDAASTGSSSADSGVDERQLMRMRRRIKGVLPASWLKLDKQARHPSPTPDSRDGPHELPLSTAPVRGVAQRKATSTSATPANRPERIVISDNSDGSDSSVETLPIPHSRQTRFPSPIVGRPMTLEDGFGEVEEYDEIDAMLPSTSRTRLTKGRSKKRQSRLTEVFPHQTDQVQESRTAHPRRVSGPSTTRKPRPKDKATSKLKSKPNRPVQLSILDATTDSNAQPKSRPQFLRLAARQARQRPDHGRHSPTNKAIRLATREDTQEAMEPLRSWNSGRLHRTWNPSSGQRQGYARSASGSARHSTSNRMTAANPNSSHAFPPKSVQGDSPHQAVQRNQRRHRPASIHQAQSRRILETNHRMRPAQLEAVRGNVNHDLDPLTFAAPPSRLMEIFNRDKAGPSASQFRLERFLQDREGIPNAGAAQQVGVEAAAESTESAANAEKAAARTSRKRLARRVDVERVEFRQPDEPLPIEPPLAREEETSVVFADTEVLQSLGPFGTRYPTDFDVRPLEIGTYFAASTFVGSGDFDDCLKLRNRDLDLPAGRITIEVGSQSLHWSAWEEEVSVGLTTIVKACTADLQLIEDIQQDAERQTAIKDSSARFSYLLRSLVRYMSDCLHFLDPIDRSSCLNRLSRFLEEFTAMIDERATKLKTHSDVRDQVDVLLINSRISMLCLSAQSARIARHPASDPKMLTFFLDQAVSLSRRILTLALPERFIAIRTFLEEHRQYAKRDSGIQEDDVAIKSVVTINHVLKSLNASATLSDILTAHLTCGMRSTCNVQVLDQVWYDAFSVQPLLEIDSRGIFRPGKRFQSSNDNWELIRCLLQRTFDLYPATSQTRNATLNGYVRACMVRVNHLIVRWGWRKCEPVLGIVYDFFARNNLSQLHKEEGKGSPRFLEDIDKSPTIEVDARDCAFHIFLKLLVVGLRGMQDIYPKNKVRGFAWRFIPNHGRTYRKDQEMTQVALDALRNHHDLLCSLYWVLPPGSGPRLQMIMDLVDHANSHREACRLSVHSWGILARYQLSQQDPFADKDALASWFKKMVTITMSQYRLARSEAESQYALERARGSTDISNEVLEATIASNQSRIFATLLDLVQALRQAVRVSKTWVAARDLVESSSVLDVLKLFDTDQARFFVAILQTLDVVHELLAVRSRTAGASRRESQQGSEDSQEYGDWSFMEQVDESEPEPTKPKASEVAFLQDPLANLLSTCFGSEKCPDDDLLKKIVEVWTAVAHWYVKDGVHDWSSFLDVYSTLSWFQLRDTDQKHKYTAYFLSCVIKADKTTLKDHRYLFLEAWLVSLLERESMLKFQHQLTASLLENATQDPLLDNLPFAANSRTGQYDISLADLRERRVSLIGCILSNMRASLESTLFSRPSAASELRRNYTDMLKQAMQYMRRTYEELQDMSGRLGTSYHVVQGAYVTLVQQIISLMQQYTSDICHIDNFFVDSSVFPLPANDPTYVVGRLKSYVSKLADPKARKQLAVFIQTVSERAALDNQQPYLVGQLQQALSGKTASALRKVFMTAVLPAYVSGASSNACGWILAMPLIKAATLVTSSLIYDISLSNETSLDTDIESITSLLRVLHGWALTMADDPHLLVTSPSNLQILGAVFDTASASFTVVDFIHRSIGKAADAVTLFRNFKEIGKFFSTVFNDHDDLENAIAPDAPPCISSTSTAWSDTLEFSTRGLREDLNRAWVCRGDSYYVARGNNVREVVVDIGLVEEEKARANHAVERAQRDYRAVFELGNDTDVDELDLQRLADLWV